MVLCSHRLGHKSKNTCSQDNGLRFHFVLSPFQWAVRRSYTVQAYGFLTQVRLCPESYGIPLRPLRRRTAREQAGLERLYEDAWVQKERVDALTVSQWLANRRDDPSQGSPDSS